MARTKKLHQSRNNIINFFKNLARRVLTYSEINEILLKRKAAWQLPKQTTIHEFITFMLEEAKLRVFKFEFPYQTITRYAWGSVSIWELALSLKPNSYFTHQTAMYFHKLTEQLPETIYLNFEQFPKRYQDRDLHQDRIDAAFKNAVRVSKNIALYKEHKICILNGMYTGKLGVIEMKGPRGEKIPVTDIERTLIDIAVRPVYSGGVSEVLKAYRLARGKISIEKLSTALKKLNYIYPYHQVVGFYLEKAGVYDYAPIDIFHKFGINYDFYLTHQMKGVSYSKKWRLYFPKDLEGKTETSLHSSHRDGPVRKKI